MAKQIRSFWKNLCAVFVIVFALVGNAMAADIQTYWIGSCSHLLANQTGNNLSMAQNYCNNVGVSSSYCSTSGSGLSGNSTYKYCSGSKWYSSSGSADYTGTGVFCFKSVTDCTTAMGLSGGNTNSNTVTTRKKGIKVDSYYQDALYGGMVKQYISVLNTAFFECINSCSNYTDWVLNNTANYGVYESRDKQYCMFTESNNTATCRPEASTSTTETRCPVGYYDVNRLGTVTGLPPKVLCTRCPLKDGVPDEYITTQYAGVANFEYGCVISANKDIEDISGTYSFVEDCPHSGDGSGI